MQALFALTFPVGKLALQYTGSLFLVGLRMTLGGLLLLAAYYFFGERTKIARSDWYLFIKMAFFAVYLAFVPEFWALKSMSALKTNMLWSSLPFISALLSYFLLGERLTLKKWAGLAIGLVGMLPVIFISSPQELHYGTLLHVSLPDLMMTLAVVASAYGWFLMRELLNKGYSVILVNGSTMLIGGILCFGTKIIEQSLLEYPQQLYTSLLPVIGYTAVLILISNVIGYNLYGYLMRHCSLTFLSFTGFLCPLFGAFFSNLILHEQITYHYGIAFVSVCLGLWIFYSHELQNDPKIISCKK